eukprot:GEMP01102951.1.p1 GENE.GEMP01102951.1~~GEMP01102951.1.p1  ORF type:complete len:135 (+),score=3.02 GEMP01102951.1:283-687(+)
MCYHNATKKKGELAVVKKKRFIKNVLFFCTKRQTKSDLNVEKCKQMPFPPCNRAVATICAFSSSFASRYLSSFCFAQNAFLLFRLKTFFWYEVKRLNKKTQKKTRFFVNFVVFSPSVLAIPPYMLRSLMRNRAH